MKLYYCYSENLKEWLDKNGLPFKFQGTHNITGNKFWAYPLSKYLNELLQQYSKGINKS